MNGAYFALAVAVVALLLGVYLLGRVHDVHRFKGWLVRIEKDSKDRDDALNKRMDTLASEIVKAVDAHMSLPATYNAVGVSILSVLIRSQAARRELSYLGVTLPPPEGPVGDLK